MVVAGSSPEQLVKIKRVIQQVSEKELGFVILKLSKVKVLNMRKSNMHKGWNEIKTNDSWQLFQNHG